MNCIFINSQYIQENGLLINCHACRDLWRSSFSGKSILTLYTFVFILIGKFLQKFLSISVLCTEVRIPWVRSSLGPFAEPSL